MNTMADFSLFRRMSLAAGIALLLLVPACSGAGVTTSTSSTPVSTLVINSDSVITGEVEAIRRESTGYPWEVDVLVLTSRDVDGLPNPTIDKIGQVITAKSETDMSAFKAGSKISANVKYTGDVPLPGISLLIFNIKPL